METQTVPTIHVADLAGPVSAALAQPVRAIAGWTAEPIGYRHVTPTTGGLSRVQGAAVCDDGEVAWSAVLKVCRKPSDAEAALLPREFLERVVEAHRWDREPLAYESGLLADLGDGLVAPRFFGLDRREDGAWWLWLEDIASEPEPWTAARFQLAARHLGQFNGLYLTSRALPTSSWLSRRWLQSWFGSLDALQLGILDMDAVWDDPLVHDAFPVDARVGLRQALAARAADDQLLDALPQTLAHLDPFRSNLMSRAGGDGRIETVAVDWSFVGIAPIGADASQLATFGMPMPGEPELDERERAVWKGYLEGLRDVGWQGDVRVARVGYLASSVVRWIFVGLPLLAAVHGAAARLQVEQQWQMGVPEFVRLLGARTAYILAQARELRELIPAIVN